MTTIVRAARCDAVAAVQRILDSWDARLRIQPTGALWEPFHPPSCTNLCQFRMPEPASFPHPLALCLAGYGEITDGVNVKRLNVLNQPPGESTTSIRPRRDFVASLAKGLELLEAFEHGELLGNQELVARTGLPKATVSRLAGTLTELGYLRLDERTRKYMIGARLLGMGASVQHHLGVQRAARPYMEALSAEMDISVILGVGDRTSLIFLDLVRPARYLLDRTSTGGSLMPIESTSIGLAYLVKSPVNERMRILDSLRQHYCAARWKEVRHTIETAHADYDKFGFVVSQHADPQSVSGVGVPMTLGSRGLYAFSCAGSSGDLPRNRLVNILGPRLVEMVEKVRSALLRSRG